MTVRCVECETPFATTMAGLDSNPEFLCRTCRHLQDMSLRAPAVRVFDRVARRLFAWSDPPTPPPPAPVEVVSLAGEDLW